MPNDGSARVDRDSPVPPKLQPFALKDAPALIEAVFPAQKISAEAQKERKAQADQTLTALGSYWKGRKPLILVRSVLLGSLLPQTEDPEKDLEIFEKLMAIDDLSFGRRQPNLKPWDIAERISLHDPWNYFDFSTKQEEVAANTIKLLSFPVRRSDYPELQIRWRSDIDVADKHRIFNLALEGLSYQGKLAHCERPEKCDSRLLYGPIWHDVNAHLGRYGVSAESHADLVEQLGILRFGRRPLIGDAFCGGGSVPYEAARLGCDAFGSDLNPVACMLAWGALNIVGADSQTRTAVQHAQEAVAARVDSEITRLGIEHKSNGDRAKAFLYCLETRCPDTGWMIPMSTTWVISRVRPTIAELVPDPANKRFDIRIRTARGAGDLAQAEVGTVRDGYLVYEIDGKQYRRSIASIRGDYRDADGRQRNTLRPWELSDFLPRRDDRFQERLYCVQWMTAGTLHKRRPTTYFESVTDDDLQREQQVQSIVAKNLDQWQRDGLVPDMPIEPGDKTDEPIRTRGWTHWHHLFNARQLCCAAMVAQAAWEIGDPFIEACLAFDRTFVADKSAKLSQWRLGSPGRAGRAPSADGAEHVFYNQALNTFYNYATRGLWMLRPGHNAKYKHFPVSGRGAIATSEARAIDVACDVWITDPPYADAIVYHEITEYFIAWLRRNPPAPFAGWIWDSRRDLAITGSGDDFRRGMVDAYKAMTDHMPDNGMQCVMFTHQDTGVWSDMVSIFWAAGLQVVGAWYIATETTLELKKGGYVQGTVILMLRKRPSGDRPGFKQRMLPQVKREVDAQIKQMLHLNTETEAKMGDAVFNDSDLQMAGYAAALKVLTGYTSIGGEDVTTFALRPRRKGETTVVDEIVEQAAETANSLLVPEGLDRETWHAIAGIQRFYLRMLDMETTGASKLDNYQNFAKAFRVRDYAAVMASIKPNAARLKSVTEFKPRDLTDRTEIGPTPLGTLIVTIQEFLAEKEPDVVMANLRDTLVDYLHLRPMLMDMAYFIAAKARVPEVRRAAEAIASRIRHQRLQ
jgi:putative DNA methylase